MVNNHVVIVSHLRRATWDPFPMAFPWFANGVILTTWTSPGMILQPQVISLNSKTTPKKNSVRKIQKKIKYTRNSLPPNAGLVFYALKKMAQIGILAQPPPTSGSTPWHLMASAASVTCLSWELTSRMPCGGGFPNPGEIRETAFWYHPKVMVFVGGWFFRGFSGFHFLVLFRCFSFKRVKFSKFFRW